MKFPTASHGGLSFRLLLIAPNWDRPPVITHRMDTTIGEGRTTIEERRPERAAWLLSQRVLLTLLDTDADDWRKGIAALGSGLVGMPIWSDAMEATAWKANRVYEPQMVVIFNPTDDTFAFADGPTIAALSDITLLTLYPSPKLIAPLLLGRLKQRPPAEVFTVDGADIDLELVEASPYGWRVGVNTYGAGWDKLPDRIAPVRDASDYGLEQIQLSSAREPGLDRTSAAARWLQEGEFSFVTRLEIRTALSAFAEKRGSWASWSPVPAWFQPGADTAGTPDDYTARFASDTLALTFATDAIAGARVGFIQEIDTPSRSQALAGEAYLYRLVYDHDTGNPELFTNWDAPLTATEGVYASRQIAHQDILRSLKPQDERAEIQMDYVAGSLCADWIVARLFGLVRLTIWKCDPADPAGTQGSPLFSGIVQDIRPEGNTLTLTATLFGTLLKRRVPGWSFGPGCNTYLFSPLCGLAEGNYDSAGTAAAADLSSDGLTLTVHDVTGWSGPMYPDNHFAFGILRTGATRKKMIATIVSSTMAAGNVVVKLNRPLWADLFTGTQAVTLIPGCGGQYETDCLTKFAGAGVFRGFPFIPAFIETRAAGSPKAPKK